MGTPPQSVEHQNVEIAELAALVLGDGFDIGDVGEIIEAIAEDAEMTVLEGEWKYLDACHLHYLIRLDHV
jgi:hypothetical protein